MQVIYFANFIKSYAVDKWEEGGVDEVHNLTSFTKGQYFTERVGLVFGLMFLILAPILFLPVARGSLINTFLGVKYGTMVKWHRYAQLLFWCAMSPCTC